MAIAALITWVVTAGFGFFMLGTWLSAGGARPGAGAASHFRPPVVFGHFLLAAAGLVLWVVYVFNDASTLAWVAFADLVVVAGIGDTLVLRWFRDHRAAAAEPSGPVGGRVAPGSAGSTDTLTGRAAPAQLAEQRIPAPAVVMHGLFAVTTIVLVLLAALGVGS
jgi:hypothetical protein